MDIAILITGKMIYQDMPLSEGRIEPDQQKRLRHIQLPGVAQLYSKSEYKNKFRFSLTSWHTVSGIRIGWSVINRIYLIRKAQDYQGMKGSRCKFFYNLLLTTAWKGMEDKDFHKPLTF